MGFGPIGHNDKEFGKMSFDEMEQYQSRADDVLRNLRRKEYEANDEDLKYWLQEASAHGMLYFPNNQPATKADVSKMLADPKTASTLVSDLIVVRYDQQAKTNVYRSMIAAGGGRITADRSKLTEDQLAEKRQGYHKRQHDAALAKKIASLQGDDRTKYREDVKAVFDKLNAGNLEMGSPALTECIEAAIDLGIVRTVKGVVPAKANAAEFAKRPAFLKSLVFAKQSAQNSAEFDSFRLNVADGNPPTAVMDSANELTSADIAQMDKDVEALGPMKDAVGIYVKALDDKNEAKIADYEKRLKEFGYKVNHLDGLSAFSLADEKQVYFYGNPKPISTPEDYIKAIRHNEAPKAPNKWGIFEGLRSFWHNHISKLPDYEDYERERELYELDKYRLAEKAGLDVSGIADKAKEYDQKYGGVYDAYCRHQEVETWARDFSKRTMNADEKAFINDFKEAMHQYPAIAAQIMKDAPNVSKNMLEELVFAAQPYAELSQAGDFDKKTLGVLSALGVAAECDLFSSELKEQIFGLCKALNKDFGSAYGAEFLTGEQEKQAIADLGPDKNEPEVVVVGGENGVVDLDDVKPEKEQKTEVVGGGENGVVDLDDKYIEEMDNALRAMTEEQKRILADKIDGLTDGEKNTLEKLAKDYGFDINNLDLNKTVSETVDEKTMDLPQINV